MNDEEQEEAHEEYMHIADALKKCLDQLTAKLSPEADKYVRNILGDTFRFWRD